MGRRPTTTLAAVALCSILAVSGLVEFPSALGKLDAARVAAEAVPPHLREFAGAFQTDIDRDYLLTARALIGTRDSYYFDLGNGVRSGNSASHDAAEPVTQFLLYPRRPTLDPRRAQWLICYGCDLARWKSHLEVVWQKGGNAGITIGRLHE